MASTKILVRPLRRSVILTNKRDRPAGAVEAASVGMGTASRTRRAEAASIRSTRTVAMSCARALTAPVGERAGPFGRSAGAWLGVAASGRVTYATDMVLAFENRASGGLTMRLSSPAGALPEAQATGVLSLDAITAPQSTRGPVQLGLRPASRALPKVATGPNG